MPQRDALVRGRQTAQLDEPKVLFLIGMRFNALWRFDKWAWFLKTMPSMLAELERKPEAGLLWYRTYISGRNVMVQQYWESFEKLLAYAQDKEGKHFPNWARFNRTLAKDGIIGIWHETFLIEPGKFECIYGDMPPFGLAAATRSIRAEGRLAQARERFAA
ncbi:MAG: DUF4188 domain-containing protein [Alphaproteobacteria bacterium]|nr:DUF4188 domain-containing protein [Alphaproteobacteria bacterium]